MKVLLINGSPHESGCTSTLLKEVAKELNINGVETEIIFIGNKPIRGCVACGRCAELKKCVFDDEVNVVAEKFRKADGLILGSPVYFASANGTLVSFLDRLFMSSKFDKTMKVGATVVSARRAGTTATFDMLNKYFSISSMPIASSNYWNMGHGSKGEDILSDEEGLQTMRVLARNVAFLVKAINAEKEKSGLPVKEEKIKTNFIR